MRKFLAASLAAVTAAGAVAASASPAEARDRYYRHRDSGDVAAAAIIAGVAGLALGSALSSNGRTTTYYRGGYAYDPRYDAYSGGYYDGGYYGGGYGYYAPRYAPRTCITRERVYDPYIGRRVTIQRQYAC